MISVRIRIIFVARFKVRVMLGFRVKLVNGVQWNFFDTA